MYGPPSSDSTASQEPKYPYGLCLHLERETLAKLGIESEDDAEVGAEVAIQAKGIVTGYSISKRQDGGEYRCVDIQITGLGIQPTGEPVSESIYPSKP